MAPRRANPGKPRTSRNLRIGDHWNAITIFAPSQSNPLKAVAELVENSIDARAKTIVITRGREKGQHCLRVKDDCDDVRRNADGEPDFHYVATHVCDSIKRRLKTEGTPGLLRKGAPSYRITQRPSLLPEVGTDVLIRGILPGIKSFSGEKIQWYLAAEPRDRIRQSGVSIRVVDRTARTEFKDGSEVSRPRSIPLIAATSVSLTGVATPYRAPAATTAPLMKSISVPDPFSRLCSMEVLKSDGSPRRSGSPYLLHPRRHFAGTSRQFCQR